MASLQGSEVAGMGTDFYKWVLATLSFSRGRGGGYMRLNPPVRKRLRLARLGKTRQRSLKGRRLPRVRLRWLSPFTLLAKIRDAYVSLLRAASNRFVFFDGISLSAFPAFASSGNPSAPFGDFKAKDRELNELIKLYLSRTQTQVILPNDDS